MVSWMSPGSLVLRLAESSSTSRLTKLATDSSACRASSSTFWSDASPLQSPSRWSACRCWRALHDGSVSISALPSFVISSASDEIGFCSKNFVMNSAHTSCMTARREGFMSRSESSTWCEQSSTRKSVRSTPRLTFSCTSGRSARHVRFTPVRSVPSGATVTFSHVRSKFCSQAYSLGCSVGSSGSCIVVRARPRRAGAPWGVTPAADDVVDRYAGPAHDLRCLVIICITKVTRAQTCQVSSSSSFGHHRRRDVAALSAAVRAPARRASDEGACRV